MIFVKPCLHPETLGTRYLVPPFSFLCGWNKSQKSSFLILVLQYQYILEIVFTLKGPRGLGEMAQ